MHPVRVLGLWIALLGGGVAAAAEDPESERLVKEGLTFREQGKDAEALERFEAAYGRAKTPRTLAQIALAEQALGRWVRAEQHLTEAMKSGENEWIRSRNAVLVQALETIRGRLGDLEVRSNVEGATIQIDGEVRGTLPLAAPLRVVAGRIHIEVTAPGHLSVARTLDVPAGSLRREELHLVSGGSAAAVASGSPSAHDAEITADAGGGGGGSAFTTLGWITAAGAVGGLVLGIVGTVAGAEAADGSDCEFDPDTFGLVCGSPGLRALGIAGFVAGGVLAAGSIAFFVAGASASGGSSSAPLALELLIGDRAALLRTRF
ncbi:MAG: PEGA domain-containing protein [Deltaproteobacteria bacterium]|nr:PEGA domain-containing protein [Deltaproteobacteria bacterium]